MVGFEKGIFTPEITEDKSFENVKKKAMKGSEYNDGESFLDKVIGFLLTFFASLLGLGLAAGVVWAEIKNKQRRKELLGGTEKDVAWFRGVPVEGNLQKAANILKLTVGKQYSTRQTSDVQNLISAYMMRLFYRGAFQIIPQGSGDPTFKVNELNLTGNEASGEDLNLELDIYKFFKEASGEDAILQKKELKRWANRHGQEIYEWQKRIKDGSTLKTLTAKDVREVVGLKNFLKDFTMIEDRGAVEVGLWNNYLIFASLYGIAEQVLKDFKAVCPEYFTLSQPMQQVQDATPVVFWNTFGDSSHYFTKSAANYAARTSSGGGGGHTSFGGGGGFSGGGHSGGR